MKVDIVIPVYNQEFPLSLTLAGFNRQKTDADFHLIIIDDGSDQALGSLLGQFPHLQISYVRQENRGRAKARNAALDHMKGEFVILNDADRVPHPLLIDKHLSRLNGSDNVVSIGVPKEIYFGNPENNSERILSISETDHRAAREPLYSRVVDSIYEPSGETSSSLPWISTFSGNMGVKRKHFEAIGGFDEGFVSWGFEHFELGYRLYRNGAIFVRERMAVNYHIAHPRSMDYFVKAINDSHAYFYKKYNNKEVELLKPFMFGEISLQQYEESVSGQVPWEAQHQEAIYNKIF